MLQSELANILLCVPFSRDYVVPRKITDALTTEEFFDHCYYDPDLDELLNDINTASFEGTCDMGYPIKQEELIEQIQRQKSDTNSLQNWIAGNGRGVYVVCGDPGTGKTTYLHHLAYEKKEYNWVFFNLAEATDRVDFIGFYLRITNNATLLGKCFSTVLQKIASILFGRPSDRQSPMESREKIENFLLWFDDYTDDHHPSEKVIYLLNELEKVSSALSDKNYCNVCAQRIRDCFQNEEDKVVLFETALEMMHLLLYHFYKGKKQVIVFDNIERYIGTDEIYDDQIITFMGKMRGITDLYNNKYGDFYASKFQFIISMRTTTLRMFTPQQIADFMEHKINLSEWFPAEKIISQKLSWYKMHPELLDKKYNEQISQLVFILTDIGRTGSTMRGLRLKLDFLFNHNKRLLLDYLLIRLEDKNNKSSLRHAQDIFSNETIPLDLRKHAYRSIIWRLMCDSFRNDALFKKVVHYTKQNDVKQAELSMTVASLNYIRKILTILHNRNILGDAEMGLIELIQQLYPNKGDIYEWLFDTQSKQERSKLANVLYILNYNNRHENYWFHYINIQCNSNSINGVHINSATLLEEVLFNEKEIGNVFVQITSGGEAYLGYVVQSFEQLSSLFFNYPPLYTTIPNEEEIRNANMDSLQCVTIVKTVIQKSRELCSTLDAHAAKEFEVLYYPDASSDGISYSCRLRNSHLGYVSNFCDYLDKYYSGNSEEIRQKKDELLEKLRNCC